MDLLQSAAHLSWSAGTEPASSLTNKARHRSGSRSLLQSWESTRLLKRRVWLVYCDLTNCSATHKTTTNQPQSRGRRSNQLMKDAKLSKSLGEEVKMLNLRNRDELRTMNLIQTPIVHNQRSKYAYKGYLTVSSVEATKICHCTKYK